MWRWCSAVRRWHPGVVGIVANRLVDRFHRPAFVLSIDTVDQPGSRLWPQHTAFHLLEALESMRDLFSRFGGHRGAAGLTIDAGASVPEFRERLNVYAAKRLCRPRTSYHSKSSMPASSLEEINEPARHGCLENGAFWLR